MEKREQAGLLNKGSLQPYLLPGRLEAGCDEAGRGCLAGPVCAAAVILPPGYDNSLLNDSKKLNLAARNNLRQQIESEALSWAVAFCTVEEIDKMNIFQSSYRAMHRALDALPVIPDFLLIDGKYFIAYHDIPYECIIKGDGKYQSIAAAGILAKTHRDEHMQHLHQQYPQFSWNTNQGYPTRAHRQAIRQYGATSHHRRSFTLLKGGIQYTLFDSSQD